MKGPCIVSLVQLGIQSHGAVYAASRNWVNQTLASHSDDLNDALNALRAAQEGILACNHALGIDVRNLPPWRCLFVSSIPTILLQLRFVQ